MTTINGLRLTWPGHGRERRTACYWNVEVGEIELQPIWVWGTRGSCIHSLRLAEKKRENGAACQKLQDSERYWIVMLGIETGAQQRYPIHASCPSYLTVVVPQYVTKGGGAGYYYLSTKGNLHAMEYGPCVASPDFVAGSEIKCWDWNHDCNSEATRAGGSPHCRKLHRSFSCINDSVVACTFHARWSTNAGGSDEIGLSLRSVNQASLVLVPSVDHPPTSHSSAERQLHCSNNITAFVAHHLSRTGPLSSIHVRTALETRVAVNK